jgi:hypothetical protein
VTRAELALLFSDVLCTLELSKQWPPPRVDKALVEATYSTLVPITALPLSVRAFDSGGRNSGNSRRK